MHVYVLYASKDSIFEITVFTPDVFYKCSEAARQYSSEGWDVDISFHRIIDE